MTDTAGDQTRGDSTAFFSGNQSAQMSQNEISALCMKAARGAGMSWGMAEEAGFAASWLTARGIDGPRQLLSHLTAAQGRAWGDLCPKVGPGIWEAAIGQAICPIVLGATLSDHATLPNGLTTAPITTGPVDYPLLVCPFLCAVARAAGGVVVMQWDGGRVEIDGQGAVPTQSLLALEGQSGVILTLSLRSGSTSQHVPSTSPAITAKTITALNEFALRTTVPASDASRAGAGAASSDND
jgi:hypothetical protein